MKHVANAKILIFIIVQHAVINLNLQLMEPVVWMVVKHVIIKINPNVLVAKYLILELLYYIEF